MKPANKTVDADYKEMVNMVNAADSSKIIINMTQKGWDHYAHLGHKEKFIGCKWCNK